MSTQLNKPTEIDWARLAAYIDGEGCISLLYGNFRNRSGTSKKYLAVRVAIANTDARLLIWLRETFGGCIQCCESNRRSRTGRVVFTWTQGSAKAIRLLTECLPYFVIKKDQAELAIAFHELMPRRGQRHNPEMIITALSLKNQLSGLKRKAWAKADLALQKLPTQRRNEYVN